MPLPPGPMCAGKCHASALVGNRLLLYGGSMTACTQLAWLDLESLRWGAPAQIDGEPPCDRMSATAVFLPGGSSGGGGAASHHRSPEVLVFGGYTFSYAEVGDLHRLRLLPQ